MYRQADPKRIIYPILLSVFFLGLCAFFYYTCEEIIKKTILDSPTLFGSEILWVGFGLLGIGFGILVVRLIFYATQFAKKKRFDAIGPTEIIMREENFEFINEKGEKEILEYNNIPESSISIHNFGLAYLHFKHKNSSGKTKSYTFFKENFSNAMSYDEFYNILKNKTKH